MPVKIGDMCISCGACQSECPTGAIGEGREVYEVDAERCVECVGISGEPCCMAVCPVSSIAIDEDRPMDEAALLGRLACLCPDRRCPPLAELTEGTSRFRRKAQESGAKG